MGQQGQPLRFQGAVGPGAAMNHIAVGAAGHGAEVFDAVDDITAVPGDDGGQAYGRPAEGFRFAAPTAEQLAFLHHLTEVESLLFLAG